MKWVVDNLAKLFGALSLALLVLATVHDWAFFLVVGSKFQSIQTTYDYIASAIEWLPTLVLVSMASFASVLLLEWLKSRRNPEFGFGDQERRHWVRQNKKTFFVFAIFPLIMLVRSWFSSFPINLASAIMALALAITISLGLLVLFYGTKKLPWLWSSTVIPFLMVVFVLGLSSGADAFKGYKDVYRLELKGEVTQQVSLLRSFEKGVLIRHPVNDKVEFVRWDRIESLARVARLDERPTKCRVFLLFCANIDDP